MTHKPLLIVVLLSAAFLVATGETIADQFDLEDRSNDHVTLDTEPADPDRPALRHAVGQVSIAPLAPTSIITVCSACPHASIASALNASNNGDVIRVASGTYLERLVITKTVTLEGGWNMSFTARALGSSVIDAQRLGRVLTIIGSISPTIDGFTIANGQATNEISGTHRGGGVYIHSSGALLVNNIITNNIATTSDVITPGGYGFGGGIYVDQGAVLINANQILSNVAGAGGSNTTGQGGGVYANSSTTLLNNLLQLNAARTGNALYGYGGGAYIWFGVIRSNQFISNSASNGGAIAEAFSTIFDRNLSRGNQGSNGLIETSSGTRVTNNFIQESNCETGIFVYSTDVAIVNNTITGCSMAVYVGASASPAISNTLFFSNTTAIYADGTPILDYNGFWLNGTNFSVGSTITGTHNIFTNPMFVNPNIGDFHLMSNSLMIDAGTLGGAPSIDYDGQPRPMGNGIDIGADEYVWFRIYLPLALKSS